MKNIFKYFFVVFILKVIVRINANDVVDNEVITEEVISKSEWEWSRPGSGSGSGASAWSRPPQWEPNPEWTPPPAPKPLDCEEEIYCKCHTKTTFTKRELENVKTYLQYRWYYEASFKPLREPCKQIYVAQSWKCLSDEIRQRFVRAFRVLYENGVMNAVGELHNRWWPATHKAAEFYPYHVALRLVVERELWKVDPTLPGLPYWDYTNDWSQPHKSCVWKDWGWGGIYRNGYCVRNGNIFGRNLSVDFSPRCLKRQWNIDGTMPSFSSPEMDTSWIQTSPTLLSLLLSLAGFHFYHHLSIGGWNGDFSQTFAAHDIAFIMSHNGIQRSTFLWQLADASRLTPDVQYDEFPLLLFDPLTGNFKPSVITDQLHFFNVSQLEYWQFGYGDMCYIFDTLVEPINRVVNGEPPLPPPNGVQRLMKTLPVDMLQKYYPLFAKGKTDFTTHIFDYLPECNAKCHPMPFGQRYNETGAGRRQNMYTRYAGGLDLLAVTQPFHIYWWNFMVDLNSVRYCSSTVNT